MSGATTNQRSNNPVVADLARALTPRHAIIRPGEQFNVATALAGLAASVAALAWLMKRGAPDPATHATLALYGASLIALFLATTLHHLFPHSARCHKADRLAIYGAIVGTAAPVCLLVVGGAWGVACFAAITSLALAGALVQFAAQPMPPRANVWLYLPVPAPIVAALAIIVEHVPLATVALLVAALACFAGGALVDAHDRPAPRGIGAHGLFHVAVLTGSTLTFAFVALAT